MVAARLIVGLPFFAVSWFGFSSINLNRRLYEEYNHKQRVMQLYHSFQKEIEQAMNNELKIKLLNTMLDVVQDKPSEIINKYDKHVFEKVVAEISQLTSTLVEKIPGLNKS